MPAVTEQDLEQLEAYVDGELSTTEEDALRARMAADPLLAEAMKAVRKDREIRLAVWKGYEPTEQSVQRVIARVDEAVDRDLNWTYRLSGFRRVAAVAACIVLGILVGRVGNQGAVMPNQPIGLAGGGAGGATFVSNPTLEFPIVNERGQRVATQRFQSYRERNEFFEELSRIRRAQEQLRNGNGQILIPTERF